MAMVTTDNKHYTDIANAIRQGTGSQDRYLPEQMAEGIRDACQQQFSDGKAVGYRVVSGTFTPEEDIYRLQLEIASGASLIEIIPVGTPSETLSAYRMPVHYVMASQQMQAHNPGFKDLGAMVQYYYSSRYYTSYYTFDTDNGFMMELPTALVFEANMPYCWTAHYWSED